jgi:Trypsin
MRRFSEFLVTLGSAKRNIVETGRVQVITRTKVVHGKYNENNLEHDIALLKLPTPINISGKLDTAKNSKKIELLFRAGPFINTIRMPRVYDATQTFVNANAVVSGWGKTSDSEFPKLTGTHFITVLLSFRRDCERSVELRKRPSDSQHKLYCSLWH